MTRTKMKAAFLILIVSLQILPCGAQSLRYQLAQPNTGLSAYSLAQNDVLSFTGNQAALAQEKQAGLGVSAEQRFMLKETSRYLAGVVLPTRLGNIGLQVNYAGFKNFNESSIGLAYARKLGRMMDLGVQFNYYGYRIPAYGSASTVNFEIGMLMHLTDQFNAGIHVYNPVGGKLGKPYPGNSKAEKIASVYKIGLGYDASEKFFIGTEVIKEEDKPINVTAGFRYQFAKQFFAGAGIVSESTSIYAGAGVAWKNIRLNISASYHPQLGFSPGIILIMHFKRK